MSIFANIANRLAESGFIPDSVIRLGIRRLLRNRLASIAAFDTPGNTQLGEFVDMMNNSEIALVPKLANEQHYEVPADFFNACLGSHRKYSCCYWSGGAKTLDEAERSALTITAERAELVDGMDILDLGCGWGSFSLYAAAHFPNSTVTAVSNSASQREYIEGQARQRGLSNLQVITADMNNFDIDRKFDRIVSIEMFEHMRNYRELFRRISGWLKPGGAFFMHIFCHRSAAYEFIDGGPADWMSRHFFSGGIMPSEDLPLKFQEHLNIANQWRWSGQEYQDTAEAWLNNMDDNRNQVSNLFDQVYGKADSNKWIMRWRIFYLSVSELFGSHGGQEWFVGHYLFRPAKPAAEKTNV